MNKTTAIIAVAALSALAIAPTAQADLTARSFLDLAVNADLGDGWGLYDTSGPNYCLALLGFITWVNPGVFWYYMGVRYWPAASSLTVPVPATSLGPEPTDCLGAVLPPPVPNDTLNVGPARVDVGGAFHILDVLGDNQVANLAATFVDVQYCQGLTAAAVTPGDAGLAVEDPTTSTVIVGAFTALDVTCGNAGSDSLYPAACGLFAMTTGLGYLDGDAPIMMADGGCNTLENSPVGSDYVFERCVDAELFDVSTGVVGVEYDTDFAVALADTGEAAWVTTLAGVVPTGLFPHVSNLEQNNVDCNGALYGNA